MADPDSVSTFETLRGWISTEQVATIESYMRLLLAQDRFESALDGLSSGIYGDPLADSLMISRTEEMQHFLGERVYPSYGYFRVYWPDSRLGLHKDREGCDWTLSVAIARQPETPIWPLEIVDSDGTSQQIQLEVGDAIIFPGKQIRHGRSGTSPGWNMSLFLHWVTERENYFDGRSMAMQPR